MQARGIPSGSTSISRGMSSGTRRTLSRRAAKNRLTEDPRTPGQFEYLSHVDGHGSPTWSSIAADAIPIFDDPAVPAGTFASPSVVYDPALGRYLLVTFHGASTGQIGLFESAAPWAHGPRLPTTTIGADSTPWQGRATA